MFQVRVEGRVLGDGVDGRQDQLVELQVPQHTRQARRREGHPVEEARFGRGRSQQQPLLRQTTRETVGVLDELNCW